MLNKRACINEQNIKKVLQHKTIVIKTVNHITITAIHNIINY